VRQLGVQASKHTLKRFSMVLEQVPAVGDLECRWGSVTRPAGILGRAVTCDHLDTLMLAQPGREGLGRTVWQKIYRLMLFEVDENCSIDPPFL
jgi:hypothetical protein